LYLKNHRNPHYNFDYNIPTPDLMYSRDYTITTVKNSETQVLSAIISAGNIYDQNTEINKLFDIDITQSYEANHNETFKSVYKGLNKYRIKTLLEYAKESDALLSISGGNDYISDYPERFSSKVDNYLSTY
jgi:hypothetical protein